MYMAKLASRNGGEDPSVTYGDLAAVVQRKESMEFLHDILPKKVSFQNLHLKCNLYLAGNTIYNISSIRFFLFQIKYGEYLKMMQEDQDDDEEIF